MTILAVVSADARGWAGESADSSGSAPLRGVWLTANDMPVLRDREKMREAVQWLSALQMNALFPVIWNDGITYYPSQVAEQRGIQSFRYRGVQGQDVVGELVDEAHAHGMKVMPWFEFGLMVPPASDLARNHPDWLSRKRDGSLTSPSAAGEVAWLNPFKPEVQDLIRALVLEVVSNYSVDGIQFDDNMSLPREFGYDSYTLALYQRHTGRLNPVDPADPRWLRWRADRLTALLESVVREVRTQRPGVSIVISPNYYDYAYKLQLQDWLGWVRGGLVDQLLIQVYRPDLASFEEQLGRAELAETKQKIPVAVGIHTGQRNRPVPIALISDQVRAAAAHRMGVSFFYYDSLRRLEGQSGGLDPLRVAMPQ